MTAYRNWSARGRAPVEDEATLRSILEGTGPKRRDAALGLVDVAVDGLDDTTVDALAACVRTADDERTRQFAVEALGKACGGVDAIADALDDGDEWVRAEAVVALSRAAPDATDGLRAAFDDESGFVRRNALIALGKTGAADDDLLVERVKTDPHPAVREYAAQYLASADDTERAVRILAALLARDPGTFVRAKAAGSLGELGTDRAETALESHGLDDRSDDVRRTARRALARSRGVDPTDLDVDGGSNRAPGSRAPDGPSAGGEPERQPNDGDRPPTHGFGPTTSGSHAGTDPPAHRSRAGPDPRPAGYLDLSDGHGSEGHSDGHGSDRHSDGGDESTTDSGGATGATDATDATDSTHSDS